MRDKRLRVNFGYALLEEDSNGDEQEVDCWWADLYIYVDEDFSEIEEEFCHAEEGLIHNMYFIMSKINQHVN